MFVDAHLDLAYNAVRGRDLTLPASQQTPDEQGTPTVGLPDLQRAGAVLVCGTLFAEPASQHAPDGYCTADQANASAWVQMDWYRRQCDARRMRLVTSADQVPQRPQKGPVAVIVLMEGGDPLHNDDDVQAFYDAGVRIVGLAWHRTRLAGGTGEPGGLTADGRAIVSAMDRLHIIHDTSHLAEEAFWELLDLSGGPVIASHSNCRAIVPGDRQLSDRMIRALAVRGGVVGINLYERFLLPPEQLARRRSDLDDVVRHVSHVCDVVGDALHVGIGSDLDGGFGRERVPNGITTAADLPRLADHLYDGGFGDDDVHRILSGNWLDFFRRTLR